MFNQTKPESPEPVDNKQKNAELINRLQKKFDLDRDTLTIRLEHTQYGPKGHINLVLKVLPSDVASINNSTGTDENSHSRVNATVLEFLTEEAELFGIKNLDEWRETSFVTDGLDFTMMEFQRYIDQLPLENSFIKFFVSSTGQISSVSAELMPAPPELYMAAKKDTLTEERIRAIAEETLLRMGLDASTGLSGRNYLKAEKIAVPTPPYVLWKVESKGAIFIDAFTGEVLIKLSGTRR
jgi:hypothetical protein